MLKQFILVIIGILILSIIGFYNGYPLVYSDTGTYINSGFEKIVPFDRPITYGLFLSFFSFHYSAWFVVLFQNLLTAFVILELLKTFFHNYSYDKIRKIYCLILLFLVVFTGIGWYSNQLMPDFFAPLTILCFFILIIRSNIPLASWIGLSLILLYSAISHFSHLMIGTVLVFVCIVLKYLLKEKLKDLSIKRIGYTGFIVLSGWFILPAINYALEQEYTLSKGSHVFLMGHLTDTGILEEFLKENCDTPEYKDCKLCAYKEILPRDAAGFIWAGEILEKTGNWKDSKTEYNKIIRGTLNKPKYLFANMYKSFLYGLIQLTDNKIGHGLSAYRENSAPYGQIHWRFHNELNNYLNSLQNKSDGADFNLDILNRFHFSLLIICLFITVLLLTGTIRSKLDPTTVIFLVFVVASIVINSFITAGLNSPYGRLQTRVVWLFPLSIIIILIKNQTIIIQDVVSFLGVKDKLVIEYFKVCLFIFLLLLVFLLAWQGR